MVSKNKRRFKDDGFDLDLTCILFGWVRRYVVNNYKIGHGYCHRYVNIDQLARFMEMLHRSLWIVQFYLFVIAIYWSEIRHNSIIYLVFKKPGTQKLVIFKTRKLSFVHKSIDAMKCTINIICAISGIPKYLNSLAVKRLVGAFLLPMCISEQVKK